MWQTGLEQYFTQNQLEKCDFSKFPTQLTHILRATYTFILKPFVSGQDYSLWTQSA